MSALYNITILMTTEMQHEAANFVNLDTDHVIQMKCFGSTVQFI